MLGLKKLITTLFTIKRKTIMEKKQTAVEWLAEQMMHPEIHNPYIEQAKQMEKEQREQDFIEGYKKRAEVSNLKYDEISESAAKSFFNKNDNQNENKTI